MTLSVHDAFAASSCDQIGVKFFGLGCARGMFAGSSGKLGLSLINFTGKRILSLFKQKA